MYMYTKNITQDFFKILFQTTFSELQPLADDCFPRAQDLSAQEVQIIACVFFLPIKIPINNVKTHVQLQRSSLENP